MSFLENRIPFFVLIICAATSVGFLNFAELQLSPTTLSDLTSRFLGIIFLALVVERGVEIYMSMVATCTQKPQRIRYANRAALWLSFGIAFCGVRVIAQLITPDALSTLGPNQLNLLRTIDIFLTTLLLAGGADGLHQILNRVLKPPVIAQTPP